MTKEEIINRYGIEEYNRRLEQHKKHMKESGYNKKYQKEHPEKCRERTKKYYLKHPERVKSYWKTIKGRAVALVNAYNINDKKQNRFENNITADYLVNVLFPKGCIYCGETDPFKLGADRIDNSRGHSADNVVCCCEKCNKNRHTQDFTSYFLKRYKERIPNSDQPNVIN